MQTPEIKTAVVTGGASGIGLATALVLLDDGWRVAVIDRDGQALEAAARLLPAERVRFHELDITDEAAVAATLAAIARDFGPVQGVVNSAGIAYDLRLLDTSVEAFRRTLEVNLTGSFLVTREAVRHMPGRGAVVNVASVSGVRGSPGRAAYAASKGGVVTMTKALAVELAPHGIRVNAIAPGPTETPLVKAVHTPEVRSAILGVVPQGRYGQPEEMASAIAFLLDERRSSFITGQLLAVDGGITASAGWARRKEAA